MSDPLPPVDEKEKFPPVEEEQEFQPVDEKEKCLPVDEEKLFQAVDKEEKFPAFGKEFQPVDEEEEFQPSVKVEEEVYNFDEKPLSTSECSEENSELPPPESCSGASDTDNIEYYTISGTKPYFDIILAKSHVDRYQVALPTKIIPELPSKKVPVVLKSLGKPWSMFYRGDNVSKTFDPQGWKKFVVDNELKFGDCCFFELMECSTKKIVFKVIILRSHLSVSGEADGDTPETAIIIE